MSDLVETYAMTCDEIADMRRWGLRETGDPRRLREQAMRQLADLRERMCPEDRAIARGMWWRLFPEDDFFIMHTSRATDNALWWGRDWSGYTFVLQEAGTYDRDDAMRIMLNRPKLDLPFPVSVVLKHAHLVTATRPLRETMREHGVTPRERNLGGRS